MNKLFSTLMATALVAGSVATNAAVPERPYEFRKADVRAAFPTKTIYGLITSFTLINFQV